jgi:hypothetical protein
MAADEEPHLDGALMISFGAVVPGREQLAVDCFTDLSRYLGRLVADERIRGFKPFFFADGLVGDMSGFFLVEGRRDELHAVREEGEFVRQLLRAGAASSNVRVSTLVAGSEAGRLVNLYRSVRAELGLVEG